MASTDGISLIGRPSKYKQEYCQMLVDHMAQGLSFESFAAIVDTHFDTLYNWQKEHAEFFEAHKIGKAHYKIFNERLLNACATGQLKDSKPAAIIFKLKAQEGWRDGGERDQDTQKETLKIEIIEDAGEIIPQANGSHSVEES